jgi:hypothetical protein
MFVLDMVQKNYPKRRFKIGLNGLIPPSGEGNAKGQGLPLVCDLFVPHLSRPCLPLVCIGIPLVCFLSPTKKNTEYHFLDVKSAAAKKDLVAACKVISFESQTLEPLLLLGGKARLISLDLSPSVLILVALWMSLFNCLPACVSRCPALRVSLLTCAPRSVGSPGV